MQTDNNDRIDFKKNLAEWKVTIKKRWWILLVELAVIGVILLADLLTKKYAWEYLNVYGYKEGIIPGLINLTMVENRGAGFGIFQGKTVALTVITFIVVICLMVYLVFALKESEWLRISLVFIIGGGIGNIVDRIWLGYVRDFIQFQFWEDFAVFNVADSFVTVGAFMLIVVLIVMLVKEGKKNQKEFEEAHANDVPTQETDPLDMPQNLNPMLKSENTYTFAQSEQTENADVKADEQNEKTAECDNNCTACDAKADCDKTDKNEDKTAQNDTKSVGNEASDAVLSDDASVENDDQSVENSEKE